MRKHGGMSMQTSTAGNIPALTLGWRLQMALGSADISVQQMADELGMSRTSLSRWLNDRGTPPRTVFVKQWALRTGVSYEWLSTGRPATNPRQGGPDGGIEGLPRVDSNHQPSD
jgi:transcriptional regulator with XRE-family HTH domain